MRHLRGKFSERSRKNLAEPVEIHNLLGAGPAWLDGAVDEMADRAQIALIARSGARPHE
jgi:hypothetical protein